MVGPLGWAWALALMVSVVVVRVGVVGEVARGVGVRRVRLHLRLAVGLTILEAQGDKVHGTTTGLML